MCFSEECLNADVGQILAYKRNVPRWGLGRAGLNTSIKVVAAKCCRQKGARLDITPQAAERIYRATSGEAKIINTLTLGENCELGWLPQETILFEGAALGRQLNIEMGESASLLALETLALGHKARLSSPSRVAEASSTPDIGRRNKLKQL